MALAYRCGASLPSHERMAPQLYNALVWGLYGTIKGRCDHEHECEEEAVCCAEQIAACLPPQVELVAKPVLFIRVDGQFGDGEFIDEMAPSYTTMQRDWEDEAMRDD